MELPHDSGLLVYGQLMNRPAPQYLYSIEKCWGVQYYRLGHFIGGGGRTHGMQHILKGLMIRFLRNHGERIYLMSKLGVLYIAPPCMVVSKNGFSVYVTQILRSLVGGPHRMDPYFLVA